MWKKNTNEEAKQRVKIKNLPAKEKALSEKEAKKVKGGAGAAFLVDIAAQAEGVAAGGRDGR